VIHDLRRATEPRAIIAALRSVLSVEELVAVAGSAPDVASGEQSWDQRRLQELQSLVLTLSDSLTSRGVAQWLHAENRLLGRRAPLDALAAGDVPEVTAAAASFTEGAYI
jgi:hypothetical protein